MDRWVGKVAVITGASAGIGLYTAQALVEHGMIVVGLARRKDKMEEGMKHAKGKGEFHAMECDVSKQENVVQVFNSIKDKFGSVHILVNNAGLMQQGPMADVPSEALETVVNINILGLVYCTREAVKIMKEGNHEGHIINVGSYLGHKVLNVPGFYMNVYPATKFAVRALSESLQNELGDAPIRVTHISPGVVKTEFFDVAGADPAFIKTQAGLSSEDVADAIVYVIGTKPHVHIPELTVRHLEDRYR